MKATITAVAASLLAGHGAAVAQQTETEGQQDAAEGIQPTPHQAGTAREIESELFTRLDADGNGVISRQEAQDYTTLADNWSQFDQDGDGTLTEREFGDFRAETGPLSGDGESPATGVAEEMPETRHQKQTIGEDLVSELDTNGDGTISEQEAMASARLADNWDQYDENGDGRLDSGELERLEQELEEAE